MTTDITEIEDDKLPSAQSDVYVPVGVDGIVDATRKVLAMNRGLAGPDHRDGIQFKRVMTTADLLGETIAMDAGKALRRSMMYAARHRSLAGMNPGALDDNLETHLVGNPLSSPSEEVNPLDVANQNRRITLMGPGGISSSDMVTADMQCHDDKTEVFTSQGWKAWPAVTAEDQLACLIDDRMVFHKPLRVVQFAYSGDMYGYSSSAVNFLVTPNHRFWVKPDTRGKQWRWETAAQQFGKARINKASSLPFEGTDTSDVFELFHQPSFGKGNPAVSVNMGDWCEFLGWYLSEGSAYDGKTNNRYSVTISQCEVANPVKTQRIRELCERLPFTFHRKGRNFRTKSKDLFCYVKQFGKAKDKFIPEFVFNLKPEYRRRLLDAFALGDGHKTASGNRLYSSSSSALVRDLERLLVLDGKSTSMGKPWEGKNRRKEKSCDMYKANELTRTLRSVDPAKHFKTSYSGMVYCAEVPGNLLLTRRGGKAIWNGNSVHPSTFGFISPIEGPESENAGIDTRITNGVRIGSNGRLYQRFLNPRTKDYHWLSPEDLHGKTVGLPRPA